MTGVVFVVKPYVEGGLAMASLPRPATVSFDVYSALIDSRRGATVALDELASERGWPPVGAELYTEWDGRNKALHRTTTRFVPFRELAQQAMAEALAALELPAAEAADVTAALLGSVHSWPPYADVAPALAATAHHVPVALLSNTDEEMLARTRLGLPHPTAVVSEQVGHYKPHPAFYDAARRRLGEPLVHVAASARDVRGATEAGLTVIRVVRPGHELDRDGPRPDVEVDDLREVPRLLIDAAGPH